ncbi:MAG TPA: Z1 domain-containing protein, partial [Tepidisphaeraceae bacterium]|nr:Z1 domain-containing protein [Tepidisphaeraceae bacterium]
MNVDGPIYTTLLKAAESQKRPYDPEQQKVMRASVEQLMESSTSAARPGMLLGKIQSGKTKTFLGIIALAADNGYDLIIVLTKGTKALTEQTLERLKQSYSDSINDDLLRVFDIMAFPSKLTRDEQKHPIIIVAKKQARNLDRLSKLLFESYPNLGERRTLFVDDEADFASIGFKKRDEDGFAEMQKIMSQIDALRARLKSSSFLQVTATPYSLYLQPRDAANRDGELYQPIRPSFTQLVPTHKAYVGGDFYFEHGNDPKQVGSYIYVPVALEELEILAGEDRRRFKIEDALTSPKIESLRRAIVGFTIGGTVRRLQSKAANQPAARYSFVIHTMATRAVHAWQVRVTEVLVEKLIESAESGSAIFKALAQLAYDDFAPSVAAAGQTLPPFGQVLEAAATNVAKIQIEKVNSDNDVKALLDSNGQLELRNALNIFIGGSILDRGLTIDGLIGFYYGRRANRFQQDTV